jgi:DNA (cytosine-5)-methyltransferase 1
MLRVIQEIRPSWVIGENVAGIVTLALDTVLSDLENIGYTCQAVIIPACAVDAPHRRDRCAILANSDSQGLQRGKQYGTPYQGGAEKPCRSTCEGGTDVADHKRIGLRTAGCSGSYVPDANSTMRSNSMPTRGGWSGFSNIGWWPAEPDVGRVAHGVPARVDRLRALGNAVVPQVVEWIGRRIIEAEAVDA